MRLIVAFFIGIAATVSALEIPEFIRVCKRNDPNLDACITDSVEHLRPYLEKGVPEYNLPTLEPLLLKELVVSERSGLTIMATNINAFGASNFFVKRVKADMTNLHFNVDIDLPHLYIVGDYSVDGRILLLPIKGSGPMRGNVTGVVGEVVFKAHLLKDNDGIDHFHVNDFDLKITVGPGNLVLDNLFGGDKVLGDVVNNAINTNFDSFIRELTPLIEKALSDSFLEIGNNIVGPFTFDQLFPE